MSERLGSPRLGKLVALANRPGTEHEGAAARDHAERRAAGENLRVVESTAGDLIVLDPPRAELLDALLAIADGATVEGSGAACRSASSTAGEPSRWAAPVRPPHPACTCEPELLAAEIPDVACPQHGLAAFLRNTFGAKPRA